MITGKDELSREIMLRLDQGIKVKDIPKLYPVSLDQAKRLSRYRNLLEQATDELTNKQVKKLMQIGLKSLLLSPYIKRNDWTFVEDVLLAIEEGKDIKRDELKQFILATENKRKRIRNFQEEVHKRLEELEFNRQELQNQMITLEELQQEIYKRAEFLKKYAPEVQEFLLNHLGVSKKEKKLVLAKRLDINWQRTLKKKGVVEFIKKPEGLYGDRDVELDKNKDYYIFVVHDVDYIVEDYQKRKKRGWECEWNRERAEKYSGMFATNAADYKNVESLGSDLTNQIHQIKLKIQQIEDEKHLLEKDIKQLKKSSPKTFIESVEASNQLSKVNLLKHGKMQEKGLKWLFEQGYICVGEFVLPNGSRADIIGYNKEGHIIICEVKVSRQDFERDEKWDMYLPYCDEFYFLLDKTIDPYSKNINGFIQENNRGKLEIQRKDTLDHTVINREELIYSIAWALARKNLLGY